MARNTMRSSLGYDGKSNIWFPSYLPEEFNIFQPHNDPRAGKDIVNTTFS